MVSYLTDTYVLLAFLLEQIYLEVISNLGIFRYNINRHTSENFHANSRVRDCILHQKNKQSIYDWGEKYELSFTDSIMNLKFLKRCDAIEVFGNKLSFVKHTKNIIASAHRSLNFLKRQNLSCTNTVSIKTVYFLLFRLK